MSAKSLQEVKAQLIRFRPLRPTSVHRFVNAIGPSFGEQVHWAGKKTNGLFSDDDSANCTGKYERH